MSVPGAGLLALLRKRSEPSAEQPGQLGVVPPGGAAGASPPPSTAGSASKFEARSSAVHALEHAVASGAGGDRERPAAQGRRIPPGPSYVYDVDVHEPHEAQPQLSVRALHRGFAGLGQLGQLGQLQLGQGRWLMPGPNSGPPLPMPLLPCPPCPPSPAGDPRHPHQH